MYHQIGRGVGASYTRSKICCSFKFKLTSASGKERLVTLIQVMSEYIGILSVVQHALTAIWRVVDLTYTFVALPGRPGRYKRLFRIDCGLHRTSTACPSASVQGSISLNTMPFTYLAGMTDIIAHGMQCWHPRACGLYIIRREKKLDITLLEGSTAAFPVFEASTNGLYQVLSILLWYVPSTLGKSNRSSLAPRLK